MTGSRFSAAAFTVAFCVAYVAVFALDLPLFRYWPLHGDWTWGRAALKDAGPAMAWYGLMANAAIAALLAAYIVPDALAVRLLGNRVWLFAVAAMGACLFLLRKFFA
jgi:hypothetical protein